MTPDRWRDVTDLFHAAVARDPGARAAFLDDACRQDPSLRRSVESLLQAHDEASARGGTAALLPLEPRMVSASSLDSPPAPRGRPCPSSRTGCRD